MYYLIRVYGIFIFLSFFVSCNFKGSGTAGDKPEEIKGDIIIFHAGSLSVPFREIALSFEQEHPGTRVLLEAAGSVASARKITDLNKPCDIMASADYQIIEALLIPEYTTWHIPFAANEMVIAFHQKSTDREHINQDNWPEILSRKEIRYGRSDPDSDPCGYRTLMTLQLSERYYQSPGLTDDLSQKDQKYIRPKEVDLLALLELREIDYIFIYKSVAVQHSLEFIGLPREINLGHPALDEHYAQAAVRIIGDQPGKTIDLRGEAITYAVTILDDAPNRRAAEAFLTWLMDQDQGMKIMEASGQHSVIPLENRYYENLPIFLKKYSSPPSNDNP